MVWSRFSDRSCNLGFCFSLRFKPPLKQWGAHITTVVLPKGCHHPNWFKVYLGHDYWQRLREWWLVDPFALRKLLDRAPDHCSKCLEARIAGGGVAFVGRKV